MTDQPIEPVVFGQTPPVDQYRALAHVHVGDVCVKNRHGEPCNLPGPAWCCSWLDCQVEDTHEHPSEFEWTNPGDPTAGKVVVLVKDDGTVTISEAALAQLLTDAGWERAR